MQRYFTLYFVTFFPSQKLVIRVVVFFLIPRTRIMRVGKKESLISRARSTSGGEEIKWNRQLGGERGMGEPR